MPERPDELLGRIAYAGCFAVRPDNLAGRPEGRMDAFSEILSGVKLNGAWHCQLERPRSILARGEAVGSEWL